DLEELYDAVSAMNSSCKDMRHCKLLLMAQNQRAGLEVMEQMSVLMECGCEKLYRWIQNECGMQAGGAPRYCKIAQCYSNTPGRVRQCQAGRSSSKLSLRRSRVVAAARGTPTMELHSHDPQRYVGDMLPGCIQATASETESLDSLLKLSTDIASSRSSRRQLRAACLCSLSEGVCRPLRLRVEQRNCGWSWRRYRRLGQAARSAGGRDPATAAAGSDSPDSGMAPLSQRRDDLRQVLDTCIDPLLKLCTVTATRLSRWKLAIFMANSLHSLQTGLAATNSLRLILNACRLSWSPQLDALVAEQLSHILMAQGPGRSQKIIRRKSARHSAPSKNWSNWPDQKASTRWHSLPLTVQQYIQQLDLKADPSNVDLILNPPEGQRTSTCGNNEHLRTVLHMELNGWLSGVQAECDRTCAAQHDGH
uniref:Conserved oligomeric Golgi complex subunit 6 n=1 Tax=Macrostomum lignano TaxID=282301 RepID=A0A1I8FLA8_9PLAT